MGIAVFASAIVVSMFRAITIAVTSSAIVVSTFYAMGLLTWSTEIKETATIVTKTLTFIYMPAGGIKSRPLLVTPIIMVNEVKLELDHYDVDNLKRLADDYISNNIDDIPDNTPDDTHDTPDDTRDDATLTCKVLNVLGQLKNGYIVLTVVYNGEKFKVTMGLLSNRLLQIGGYEKYERCYINNIPWSYNNEIMMSDKVTKSGLKVIYQGSTSTFSGHCEIADVCTAWVAEFGKGFNSFAEMKRKKAEEQISDMAQSGHMHTCECYLNSCGRINNYFVKVDRAVKRFNVAEKS